MQIEDYILFIELFLYILTTDGFNNRKKEMFNVKFECSQH